MWQLARRVGLAWRDSGVCRRASRAVVAAFPAVETPFLYSGGSRSSSANVEEDDPEPRRGGPYWRWEQTRPATPSTANSMSGPTIITSVGEDESLVPDAANDLDQIVETLEASLEAVALLQARITEQVMTMLGSSEASIAFIPAERSESSLSESSSLVEPDLLSEDFEVDPHSIWNDLRKNPERGLQGSLLRTILDRAQSLFAVREALLDVPIPPCGAGGEQPKIVLVGDTHGQLNDVLWVLHRHGPPCPHTTYIFNGDIADRGPNAVEIFALVLSFKLHYPENVILLRGNHEHSNLNERSSRMGGGFADECIRKHGPWLYSKFQRLFCDLPLFAVIGEEVFVVHAGPPRIPATLERLRSLELIDHFPAPRSREDMQKGVQLNWSERDTIVFDSQWADPQEGSGISVSRRSIDAVKFGPDITMDFLTENGLRLMVRSHELAPSKSRRPPGCWWAQGGQCLTVFSASNYGGAYSNSGAVGIFRRRPKHLPPGLHAVGTLTLELDQYIAPNMTMISAAVRQQDAHMASMDKVLSAPFPAITRVDSIDEPNLWTEPLVPEELFHYAVGIICTHRETLWSFCHKHDEGGRVDIQALSEKLTSLCDGPELPWLWLLREEGMGIANSFDTPDMIDFGMEADIPAKSTVNYVCLLSRYYVHWPALKSFQIAKGVDELRKLIHKVLFAELTLNEAMDLFDVNSTGMVGKHDCCVMLRRLIPALSERQIHHVMDRLPWADDASIPVERCLLHLHLRYGHCPPPEDEFLQEVLPKMMRAWSGTELTNSNEVVTFGQRILEDFKKEVSKPELFQHLRRLVPLSELGFDAEQEDAFFDYLDVTRNGRVNAFEIFRAACASSAFSQGGRRRLSSWPTTLGEDIFCSFNALIHTHRPVLLGVCRGLDAKHRRRCQGELPRKQFMAVVRALLSTVSQNGAVNPFEVQLEALNSVLPDVVKYDRLLAGFEVIDGFE